MLIVTNYAALPARWRTASGIEGETVQARTLAEFKAHGARKDAVFVISGDAHTVIQLVLARRFLSGFARPIVAIDLIFRRPSTLKSRVSHLLKRPFLSGADLYINFFADARGLSEIYGIPPERCAYVPFKVNLDLDAAARAERTEEFVLTFGRSMRDFDTFFAAMERLPYPGAIARVNPESLVAHGARFTRPLDKLPANVAQLDDDGSTHAQLDMLRRAKLVVIPVVKSSFVASGISTALNAMILGKCVIGSEGPGMTDIFADEIIAVPPEDPAALAAAIARAWTDDSLRQRTAEAGLRCAEHLGGEAQLAQRLIDRIALTYG
ncbi:glycosyltransferase [Aquabacter cavernae]|uniref:glycosyltransferase n=1 Tax=Aquabacter cavernae TaxID=2496029 RepID=UPI000F8CB086|nr:glycosyltransferase [Aquabacter cavernae]